ncbi:MAG: MBL fold metallo-hydrolase [Bacteroidetes bacterium]|nr:MBL fold metallo-hydrolase [Bacteroidota bacterium]
MNIKFLQANNGDSILLTFKDDSDTCRNILIDGGTGPTYFNGSTKLSGPLKKVIEDLKTRPAESIDLLILTHIDDDHIGGLLSWFSKDKEAARLVKKVWFNSGKLIAEYLKIAENRDLAVTLMPEGAVNTGIPQAINFEDYIEKAGIWERKIIVAGQKIKILDLEFDILSPNNTKLEKLLKEWKKEDPELDTAGKEHDYNKSVKDHILDDNFKEDTKFPNGSSIAFILSYKKKKMLFLADAHPGVIVGSLRNLAYSEDKRLKVDFMKVSHHGSSGNTSPELLDLVSTKKYIISTNGQQHNHPNKQLLARIIDKCEDCELLFNYEQRMKVIFSKEDHTDYPNFVINPVTEIMM